MKRRRSDWNLFSAAALRAIGPRSMAEGRAAMRQVARMWRQRQRNPVNASRRDTPQIRFQRAVGHGETLETAQEAAARPGRATGRLAPNCPACGALVRLPNPPPPTVSCHACGQRSLVRKP